MEKKKVVVFGDLPIATKVVEYILENNGIELIGVVLGADNLHNNDPWKDVPLLKDFAKSKDINILTFEDLKKNYSKGGLALGLSCRFSKIIKKDILDLFENGIINMHGGLLPEFAGLYSCNHTLLLNSSIGGGTLHYIDEGIDSGNIIKRCEFNIEDDDTGQSVFEKTQIVLFNGLIEILDDAVNGKIKSKSIKEYISEGHVSGYFDKNSIKDKKRVDLNKMDNATVLNVIRAFDFVGYEPAYMIINNKKIYLTIRRGIKI